MPSERPPAVDLCIWRDDDNNLERLSIKKTDLQAILADLEATRRERDEAEQGRYESLVKYDKLWDEAEAIRKERDDLRAEVARLKAKSSHLEQELAMARRRDGDE